MAQRNERHDLLGSILFGGFVLGIVAILVTAVVRILGAMTWGG
jgi:hypothetical protein